MFERKVVLEFKILKIYHITTKEFLSEGEVTSPLQKENKPKTSSPRGTRKIKNALRKMYYVAIKATFDRTG